MNLLSFAFVDTSLFAATMTLKYGRHFAPTSTYIDPPESQNCQHILLRGPQDPGAASWNAEGEQVDYPMLSEWPTAGQLIANIEGKIAEHLAAGQNMVLGKVYLEEIRPGGFMGWHVDESPYSKNHSRFRLLAAPCAGGAWYSGNDMIAPGVGNLTFFNHQTLHSIVNLGPVPQISLVIDVRRPALQ